MKKEHTNKINNYQLRHTLENYQCFSFINYKSIAFFIKVNSTISTYLDTNRLFYDIQNFLILWIGLLMDILSRYFKKSSIVIIKKFPTYLKFQKFYYYLAITDHLIMFIQEIHETYTWLKNLNISGKCWIKNNISPNNYISS